MDRVVLKMLLMKEIVKYKDYVTFEQKPWIYGLKPQAVTQNKLNKHHISQHQRFCVKQFLNIAEKYFFPKKI